MPGDDKLTAAEIDHMVAQIEAGLDDSLAEVAGQRDMVLSINAMRMVLVPMLRFIFTEAGSDNLVDVAHVTAHAVGAAFAHLINETRPSSHEYAMRDCLEAIRSSIEQHLRGLQEEADNLRNGEAHPDEKGSFLRIKMPTIST
jgi:hypothetical protein